MSSSDSNTIKKRFIGEPAQCPIDRLQVQNLAFSFKIFKHEEMIPCTFGYFDQIVKSAICDAATSKTNSK